MNMVIYTPVTVTCLKMYTDEEEGTSQPPALTIGQSRDALGMIGSRAPFHSQTQNNATTTKPEHKGARTTGDVQGKVTPP